jgi:hypothetical protein
LQQLAEITSTMCWLTSVAVLAATGYLIPPHSTMSYDEMALGSYTDINAFINSSQLYAAVDAVMALPFAVSNTACHSGTVLTQCGTYKSSPQQPASDTL